jgi:hypothetical protein
MRLSNKTGRPIHKSTIEAIARVDVLLNMLHEEEREALADWIFHEGADISQTAKALLVSDLLTATTITAVAEDGSTKDTQS